jgi:thiamine-phosphate pyrophosphorylase
MTRWPRLVDAARRLRGARGGALPPLFLFSDPVRLPDPRNAARLLPAGGAAVVARGLAPEVLAGLAVVARQRRLALLVAGDGRAALRFRAGLHLPDRRPASGVLPFLLARRRRRRAALPLTAAAHGRRGIARARQLRADAVVLSPVFPTLSHPGAAALGPLRWAALARRIGRLSAVALGGVHGGNARRLPSWTAGIAAIGGFGAS